MMRTKDVDRLAAEGLISEAQAASVRTYCEDARRRVRTRAITVLAVVGGLQVLSGVLLVLGAYFGQTGALVRLMAVLALLAGFWIAWAKVHERYPRVGEWLLFFAGAVWVGGLALLWEEFLLQDATLFYVLALAGTLPIPFLARSRPLIPACALLSLIALLCMLHAPADRLFSLRFLTEGSEDWVPLSLLQLLGWSWWALCEFFRGRTSSVRDYALGCLPSVCLAAALNFATLVMVLYRVDITLNLTPTVVVAALALFALLLFVRPGKLSRTEAVLLALYAICFIPIGGIVEAWPRWARLIVSFGLSSFWVVLGLRHDRFDWLSVGVSVMLIALNVAVVDWSTEGGLLALGVTALVSGLSLIGAAVMLILGIRRMMRRKVKEVPHEVL